MSVNDTLSARIKAELSDLEQVVQRTAKLLKKADERQDDDYLDGVALNLHSFYTGTEKIFEEIARTIDGSVPTGREWHRDLLLQMSVEVVNLRPQVIQRSTRTALDEYRGFRHVVRNLYTFNLRSSRLRELVAELPNCYQALVRDLEIFCNFLDGLL